MKYFFSISLALVISSTLFSQKPSKEQMEADKKKMAEAMQKLNEKTSKMDPKAKAGYDSLLNVYGMGQRMDNAMNQVNSNTSTKSGTVSNGIVPAKNTKAIASIGGTPSTASMGAFIGTSGDGAVSSLLPAAKNKANEFYKALKAKGESPDEMGNAAVALWMQGRSQIALGLMVQVCKDKPDNIDNLNNYASMLTMMGAPEMAIPILNNLNARFKKNSTILNNLGQAWFALGDMDKSKKYLDSTLLIAAAHAQANETLCLIDENKGDKTAAIGHAKTAFKQSSTPTRKDKLGRLGYFPGAGDYNSFPPDNKSDDLLNLAGFSMPPFPKSVAECISLQPIWKQFRTDIDNRLKPLQKITEDANKQTMKRLEDQQKQFMNAMNKTIANPNSMSQSAALKIAGVPMFSDEMNARENIVLQNLQKKKAAVIQRMNEYMKGDGAALKNKYNQAMVKINAKWKDVGEGGTVTNVQICTESVKASNEFLNPYNTKLEEFYLEYLAAEKQWLNEMSYSALYTSYPELIPGINAGLQMQWLKDLSLTLNGFNFESITKYECTDAADGKGGRLTAFKDPNCTINSDFGGQLGIVNAGFNMHLDCSGLTTTVNAGAIGLTLNQDLDHAGFGDSFKNCTVSIGPKVSAGGKVGPVEASVSASAGADIEIDRTGITDVVVKGGIGAEAGVGSMGTGTGVEGRMSLNTGSGSIKGY